MFHRKNENFFTEDVDNDLSDIDDFKCIFKNEKPANETNLVDFSLFNLDGTLDGKMENNEYETNGTYIVFFYKLNLKRFYYL